MIFIACILLFVSNTYCLDKYVTTVELPKLPLTHKSDVFTRFSKENHQHYRITQQLVAYIDQYLQSVNQNMITKDTQTSNQVWNEHGITLQITKQLPYQHISVITPWNNLLLGTLKNADGIVTHLINAIQHTFEIEPLEQKNNSTLYTVIRRLGQQKNSTIPRAQKHTGDLIKQAYRQYMFSLLHEYHTQKKHLQQPKTSHLLLNKQSLMFFKVIHNLAPSLQNMVRAKVPEAMMSPTIKPTPSYYSEHKITTGIILELIRNYYPEKSSITVCLSTTWDKIPIAEYTITHNNYPVISAEDLEQQQIVYEEIEKPNKSPSGVINTFAILSLQKQKTYLPLGSYIFNNSEKENQNISESLITNSWQLHEHFIRYQSKRSK